jgi:glycosyltransferase involved in cell wall biosynthesis
MPSAIFFVYSQFPVEMPVDSPRWIRREESSMLAKKLKNNIWYKLLCGRLCKQDNLNAFWACGMLLPKLSKEINKVTTIYDLNCYIMPETMPYLCLLTYRVFLKRDLLNSTSIISISQGTIDRLLKILNIRAEYIIRPALSSIFKPKPANEIKQYISTLKINYPYILAIGIWEPRKNLERLVKAFLSLKRDGLIPQHKLVLVGRFKGWKEKRLSAMVSQNRQEIVPLGFVPDEDLPYLYGGADVFVLPSIYEGFGMPVMEALACGTPVVASDIPELHEASNEAATFINPTEEGIREGILRVLSKAREVKLNTSELMTWEDGGKLLGKILSQSLKSRENA